MVRVSFLAVAMTLALGCGHWEPVPVTINAVQADPAAELRNLIVLNGQGGWNVEVTDQYIRIINPFGFPQIYNFAQWADVHIIHRGDKYQVTAWDPNHHEVYSFRPRTHDLGSCQRFLDAFYALTHRAVPGAMPADAPPAPAQPAPTPSGT